MNLCVKITVTGSDLEALSQHVIIIFQLAITVLLYWTHDSGHIEKIIQLMSRRDIYKNFADETYDTTYQMSCWDGERVHFYRGDELRSTPVPVTGTYV